MTEREKPICMNLFSRVLSKKKSYCATSYEANFGFSFFNEVFVVCIFSWSLLKCLLKMEIYFIMSKLMYLLKLPWKKILLIMLNVV